jgi:ankyrin repeat protein
MILILYNQAMKVFLLLGLAVVSLRAQISAEARFTQALIMGDLKTAESLLSGGLNPDSRDRFGQTPLIIAATFGDNKIASLLLSYHADPNAALKRQPDVGQLAATPLQCAARTGNLQMAGMLINAGAEVNATGEAGRTPLSFAVSSNHLDMIRFLIEKGAEVIVRDAEGASPLDDAAWRGSLDVVAMLLAHGARLNESDTQTGATPINEAAYRGHTAVIRYLLQFHPNLAIPDKKGYGPLENAIRMGKEDSALLLLEPGAKVPDEAVETAIKRDESRLIRELLRRKEDGELDSGFTPLDLAASSGSVNVTRVLLEGGADANAASRNGATPLEDASLKGFESIVMLLLDRGAQVNQVNSDSGTTALYAAAAFGRDKVVKVLLERGANPSLCGRNGKTALQAAVENGYSGAAGLLRERGGHDGCRP